MTICRWDARFSDQSGIGLTALLTETLEAHRGQMLIEGMIKPVWMFGTKSRTIAYGPFNSESEANEALLSSIQPLLDAYQRAAGDLINAIKRVQQEHL